MGLVTLASNSKYRILGICCNYLLFRGYDSGDLGADQAAAARAASSVFFIALVTGQWGHLISIRRESPYFYDAIMNTSREEGSSFKRIYNELVESKVRWQILLAIGLSAITANFFNEIPAIQATCGTASVNWKFWSLAVAFSAAYFVIGEIRKWIVVLLPSSSNME